jgi:hypothetical protein
MSQILLDPVTFSLTTERQWPNANTCRMLANVTAVVRFEVFTAVTMKNVVFWDVMPCGFCKNRRFGGTSRLLHLGDTNQ